jgi:hypothetical protein
VSELRCEDLPGRLRDICRGYDSDGNPVLTPERCERYRQFFLDGQFGTDHPQAAKAVDPKSERRRAVNERRKQKQRLISWLKFFRLDTDRGVGDTANRINSRTGPRRELHLMLESLLKQCSCSRRDAVARLNHDYPY